MLRCIVLAEQGCCWVHQASQRSRADLGSPQQSLAQLMDVLKAPSKASGARSSSRIIAGNTGSGMSLQILQLGEVLEPCQNVMMHCASQM